MDVNSLFLERCRQVARLLESRNEIDHLDLAAILRQLFLDDYPLTHKVNQEFRLKLRFRVGKFRHEPDEHTSFQSLEDGVDPETRPPGSQSQEVNFDGFINHKILFIKGRWHSIRDVIKHASDVQGGVHRSDPKEQHRLIAAYSASFKIGGLPAAIRQLTAIGRIALRGLKPLIVAVEEKVQ